MRLLSLSLFHVCQHRELHYDFHPHVNSFVGANGAGKSNLLKSIEATITGDFAINAGVKADNVSQFAADGDPSRIVLKFAHGDRTVTVQRGLRSAKSVLLEDGEEPVVGDTRVTAAISKLLGLTPEVIAELTFPRQRRLFDFLVGNQARRSEIFQTLFGAVAAERAYVTLSKELSSCPVRVAGDEAAALAANLASAAERLASLRAEAASLAADEAAAAGARAIVAAASLHDQQESAAAMARRRADSHREETTALDAEYNRLDAEAGTFREAQDATAGPAVEARGYLEIIEFRRRNEQARGALELQRAHLVRDEADNVDPGGLPAEVARDARDYDAHQGEIRGELRGIDLLAAAVAKGHPCPTCGTPAVDLGVRHEEMSERGPYLRALLVRLEAASKAAAGHRRRELEYQRNCVVLVQRRERLEATAAAIRDADPPGCTAEECRAVIAENEDFRKRADAARSSAAMVSSRRSLLSRLIAQADSEAVVTAPTVSEADLARARAVLDEQKRVFSRRAQIEGQVSELGSAVARDEDRLVRVRAAEAEAARGNAWRDRLESWRAVVHRDGLPRAVSQSYLDEIEADLNDLLEEFGARFRVDTQGDLSFLARFADGRRQPAARLSDGEKILLAIAFRIVINKCFAGELGLITFDEPTDALDSINVGCLEVAISRLRAVSESRNLQTLLVTHERKLARLADATLDLGGWG